MANHNFCVVQMFLFSIPAHFVPSTAGNLSVFISLTVYSSLARLSSHACCYSSVTQSAVLLTLLQIAVVYSSKQSEKAGMNDVRKLTAAVISISFNTHHSAPVLRFSQDYVYDPSGRLE